jgi:hypothetical protein
MRSLTVFHKDKSYLDYSRKLHPKAFYNCFWGRNGNLRIFHEKFSL